MINEELAEAVTDPWQKQLLDEVQKELISEPELPPKSLNQTRTTQTNDDVDPLTTSSTTTTTTEVLLTTIDENLDKEEEEKMTTEKDSVIMTTTESDETTTDATSDVITTTTTTTPAPSSTTLSQPRGPPMPDMPEILGTSTTTEISHETEICFRGRCVKTKGKLNEDRDLEASE